MVDGFEKAVAESRAKPELGFDQWLWPGLGFGKAKAGSGQAKAGASRPSRAGTSLLTSFLGHDELHGQYKPCQFRLEYCVLLR